MRSIVVLCLFAAAVSALPKPEDDEITEDARRRLHSINLQIEDRDDDDVRKLKEQQNSAWEAAKRSKKDYQNRLHQDRKPLPDDDDDDDGDIIDVRKNHRKDVERQVQHQNLQRQLQQLDHFQRQLQRLQLQDRDDDDDDDQNQDLGRLADYLDELDNKYQSQGSVRVNYNRNSNKNKERSSSLVNSQNLNQRVFDLGNLNLQYVAPKQSNQRIYRSQNRANQHQHLQKLQRQQAYSELLNKYLQNQNQQRSSVNSQNQQRQQNYYRSVQQAKQYHNPQQYQVYQRQYNREDDDEDDENDDNNK